MPLGMGIRTLIKQRAAKRMRAMRSLQRAKKAQMVAAWHLSQAKAKNRAARFHKAALARLVR